MTDGRRSASLRCRMSARSVTGNMCVPLARAFRLSVRDRMKSATCCSRVKFGKDARNWRKTFRAAALARIVPGVTAPIVPLSSHMLAVVAAPIPFPDNGALLLLPPAPRPADPR